MSATARPVRFGLYGCNMYRTRNLSDALLAGCPGRAEIVAGYDRNPEMLQAAAERYGVTPYESLDAFLAHDFDVALISLPPIFHAPAYRECAAAGKDVYLEKPVCVDDEGRAHVLGTARLFPGCRCYVGLSYRHVTVFRKVAEILRSPHAGPIVGWHHHWLAPGTPTHQPLDNWRHRLETSGGQLVHHCCHVFDWFRWVGGEIDAVSAVSYVHPGAVLQHEEQEVTAACRYASGAHAVFNLSQHSHRNIQFGTVHAENLSVTYEWGANTHVKVYRQRPRAAEETYEWSLTPNPGDGGELDRNISQMTEFLDAYQAGETMPISLADAVRTYDIVGAIRRSAREGQRVTL